MRSNPKPLTPISGYWSRIIDVQFTPVPGGIQVDRMLLNGESKPIAKLAPDLATARRWYTPLVGCNTWVRS